MKSDKSKTKPQDPAEEDKEHQTEEPVAVLIREVQQAQEEEKSQPKKMGAGETGGWVDELAFPFLLALLKWWQNRNK